MKAFVTASQKFVNTNSEMAGEYKLKFKANQMLRSRFPIMSFPDIPWRAINGDKIYSMDGVRYAVVRNEGFAYFSSNAECPRFPVRCSWHSKWTYESESAEIVADFLNLEEAATSGEVLGYFEVPRMFMSMVCAQTRKAKRLQNIPEFKKTNWLSRGFAKFYQSDSGGLVLDVCADNTNCKYGGLIEGSTPIEEGNIISGIALVIPGTKYSELLLLRRLINSGSRVRASRAKDGKTAYLEWSSPKWDGTAITTAEIQTL